MLQRNGESEEVVLLQRCTERLSLSGQRAEEAPPVFLAPAAAVWGEMGRALF